MLKCNDNVSGVGQRERREGGTMQPGNRLGATGKADPRAFFGPKDPSKDRFIAFWVHWAVVFFCFVLLPRPAAWPLVLSRE